MMLMVFMVISLLELMIANYSMKQPPGKERKAHQICENFMGTVRTIKICL